MSKQMEKEKGGEWWSRGFELLVGRGWRGLACTFSRVPLPTAVSHCPHVTGTPLTQPSTWGSARSSSQSRIDFISSDVRTAGAGLPV